MSLFTWEDVAAEAKRRGVDLSARSAADQRLLRTDPDRAMRAVDIWAGWDAATPEQKALDHQWLEDWRADAGYSGGGTGLELNWLNGGNKNAAPDSFPTWEEYRRGNGYGNATGAENAIEYRTGSATERPAYDDAADRERETRLAALLGYGDFSYDSAADPLFAQVRKTYVREGRRAGQDALARSAELTGGVPSSWAQTAASQAENYYASQLADKLPELEQRAWQRDQAGYSRARDAYDAAAEEAERYRERYRDALSQYDADRAFDYGVYGDAWQRVLELAERADAQAARSEAKDKAARTEGLQAAALMAALGDYSGYAPYYGQEWAERMQALYDAANAPAAYGGGGAGKAKKEAGEEPEAEKLETAAPRWGREGLAIANAMSRVNSREGKASLLKRISDGLKSGKLGKDEAAFLRKAIGA
ncbi:MAG: hypothetical protein IJR65_06080 [Oscillospiraceae bacterium]|nr:hypothetical protein [Oscillospiraceae bacterium]